jgi:hypothetical protein
LTHAAGCVLSNSLAAVSASAELIRIDALAGQVRRSLVHLNQSKFIQAEATLAKQPFMDPAGNGRVM